MEGLTRLVSESLARHGFDRPLDYRRLHWSRWFRCESHHSLLLVPSRPGVFALAEELVSLAPDETPVGIPESAWDRVSAGLNQAGLGGPATLTPGSRRMLAVARFFEDDDMAFVLDRMLAYENPMRARLNSGRYFVRFVVIEDGSQRRSICNALNQWIANSSEKVSGIGSHFASSLELTPATEYVAANDAHGSLFDKPRMARAPSSVAGAERATRTDSRQPLASQLDSGATSKLDCPSPFPSGF